MSYFNLVNGFSFQALLGLICILLLVRAICFICKRVYFLLFYKDEEITFYVTIPTLVVTFLTLWLPLNEFVGLIYFCILLGIVAVFWAAFSALFSEILGFDKDSLFRLFKKVLPFVIIFLIYYFYESFLMRLVFGIIMMSLLFFISGVVYLYKAYIKKDKTRTFLNIFFKNSSIYLFFVFFFSILYLMCQFFSVNFMTLFLILLHIFRENIRVFYSKKWEADIMDESKFFFTFLKFTMVFPLMSFLTDIFGDAVVLSFCAPIFNLVKHLNFSYIIQEINGYLADLNRTNLIGNYPLRKQPDLEEVPLFLLSTDNMLITTPDLSISEKIKKTFVAMNKKVAVYRKIVGSQMPNNHGSSFEHGKSLPTDSKYDSSRRIMQLRYKGGVYRKLLNSQLDKDHNPFFDIARCLSTNKHDMPLGSVIRLEKNMEWFRSCEQVHAITLAAQNLIELDKSLTSFSGRISPNEHLYLCSKDAILKPQAIRDPTVQIANDGSNKVLRHYLGPDGKLMTTRSKISAEKIQELMNSNILTKSEQGFLQNEPAQQMNTGDFFVEGFSKDDGCVIVRNVEVKTFWGDDKYFEPFLKDTESRYPIHHLRILHVLSKKIYYKSPGESSWSFFNIDGLDLDDEALGAYFKQSNDHFYDFEEYKVSADLYIDNMIVKFLESKNNLEE